MEFMLFFLTNYNAFMKSVAMFVIEAIKNIHPATHASRNESIGIWH